MKRIVSFILVLCLLLSLCAFVGEGGDADPESSPEAPVVCTCGQPDGVHTADCPLYIAPADEKDEPECTCGQPDGVHTADCPLYIAPADEKDEPECTCGAGDGELHAEGCPLYVAPDEPTPTVPPVEEDSFDVAAAYAYMNSLEPYSGTSAYLETLTEEQLAALMVYIAEVEGPFEPAPEFTKAGPILNDGIRTALPVMRAFSLRSAVTGFEGKEMVDPASGLNVGKTVTTTPKTDSAGNPIYQIDLTASAKSNIVVTDVACDIVLVLDRSGSMEGANMSSLVESVNGFLSTVQQNSPDSRVAIVSYAGSSSVDTGTEYSDALRPITSNNTVNIELTTVVDGLIKRAKGGTHSDEGLEAATKILQAVPKTDPNYDNNRVVILFTDGVPGNYSFSFDNSIAQESIHWAHILKNPKGETTDLGEITSKRVFLEGRVDFYSQAFYGSDSQSRVSTFNGALEGCGATVYSVGLNLEAYSGSGSTGSQINEYLYRVSSHRPDGSHVGYDPYNDWEKTWPDWNEKYPDDLTRNRPEGSYYPVGNESALNGIFQKIAQQTGKSIENTTIRDYITPGFDICDAKGNVYEVGKTITNGSVTGTVKQDANGVYVEWTEIDLDPGDETGAGAKSFSQTIYLKPKAEFWGGNKVPTNIKGISGVYDKSGNNIGSFPEPAPVDVPVKKPDVAPTTSNIYFGGDTPADSDLYNFTAPTEAWQTAYVDITLPDGVVVNNTQDGEYEVMVTVTPKNEGTYEAQSTTVTSNVNVFTPEAQFADSTIYLGNSADYSVNAPASVTWKHGDTAADDVIMIGDAPAVSYAYDKSEAAFTDCTAVQPTPKVNGTVCGSANDFTVHVLKPSVTVTLADTSAYYGDSYTPNGGTASVSWADGNSAHTRIPSASGAMPYSSATLKYYSDAAKTTEMGTITMPNEDVNVYVKAFAGEKELTITSSETNCSVEDHNCETHNGGYFIVHPLTCSLTITKDMATGSALFDENDSFIFTVTGNNMAYPVSVKAVITGKGSTTIVGLPVGTYTVTEDGGWSWRYTADDSKSDTVSAADPTGAVTVTNALTINKWLSGSSYAVNTWNGSGITAKGILAAIAKLVKGV